MPQHWHYPNGELVENTTMKQLLSKLESETFIFDLGAKAHCLNWKVMDTV